MSRVNDVTSTKGFAVGYVFKAFTPSFTMIDLSDEQQCREIFELNRVPMTLPVNAPGNIAHT